MKHTLVATVALAAMAVCTSALAGPDWTVIERARAQKRAEQQALVRQQKACEMQAASASATTDSLSAVH